MKFRSVSFKKEQLNCNMTSEQVQFFAGSLSVVFLQVDIWFISLPTSFSHKKISWVNLTITTFQTTTEETEFKAVFWRPCKNVIMLCIVWNLKSWLNHDKQNWVGKIVECL